MQEPLKKRLLNLMTNRMLVLTLVICGMFYYLVTQLFDLQIMRGDEIAQSTNLTRVETLSIQAPRGAIYDRHGRPLAINKTAYTIKLNPGMQLEDLNGILLNFANFMEAQGQPYETDFPISREMPRTFLFGDSESRARHWREDMNVTKSELNIPNEQDDVSAEEVFGILRRRFGIPEDMPEDDAWKVLAFRSLIYVNRYRLHIPITVAYDVSKETVVMLEEHGERYKCFYADVEPLREYPGGMYVSHMIGYSRRVAASHDEVRAGIGYTNVGQTGLELAFESSLKGENGQQTVTIGPGRRPVAWETTAAPTPGDNLHLTIDLSFQQTAYHILEDMLKQILKNKLLGVSNREAPITLQQLLTSMVRADNISVRAIMESPPGSESDAVKQYILANMPDADVHIGENIADIKAIVYEGIESRRITPTRLLLVMHEQETITGDEAFVEALRLGRISALSAVLQKIDEDEITPHMTNLDPSTGTVVVVDVDTGAVLAAVNYPSYDNNQFVNHFNNAYWYRINNENDRTRPMTNRAFMEPRAPGSTFKMISAATGLETGHITARTRIYDGVAFTKAGNPPARCWSSVSHGHINVVEALAVSCNYFFSEMAYSMGNFRDGNQYRGIDALNKYMVQFGLNERSGVEIGEYRDTLMRNAIDENGLPILDENGAVKREPLQLAISSKEFKEYMVKSRNPDALLRDYGWFDIDTVFTAFGQSYSNYTAAVMAKYIATLANRGNRKDLRLMDALIAPSGDVTYGESRNVRLDVDPATFALIHDGMMGTTAWGTGSGVFSGFPIDVAGKTGTAQEIRNRSDHSAFGAYAPAHNPQIAVYVLIPFGETLTLRASSARVARDVIGAYFGIDHEPERPPALQKLSI